MPTLEVGDRVLVNKLSYDLHDVHRGDIVVFAAEPNREWHRAGIDDLVKRVDRAARARPSPSARPTASASTASCSTRATCPRAPSPRSRPTLPYITDATGKKVLVCATAGQPRGRLQGARGQDLRDGRQPTNSSGRARATARSRSRASSAACSCASGRPAASASCSRGCSVRQHRELRRRWRPCGRRGRSRRRRCPWPAARGGGGPPGRPSRTPARSKRWNSPTRPAVQSVWCMFTTSMPDSASRAAWRSSGHVDAAAPDRVHEVRVGRPRARASRATPASTSTATAGRVAPAAAGRRRRCALPAAGS